MTTTQPQTQVAPRVTHGGVMRDECDDDEDEAAESHETLGSRATLYELRPIKAKRAGAIVGLDG